jgi:hypothetical protein
MRPSKLTQNVIDQFQGILEEWILFATDEELIDMLNERLTKEERIDPRTFRNWKAGTQENNEVYDQFFPLIKKALLKEKKRLLEMLQGDEKAWQRWAWIIERKFDEWNIKNKLEGNIKQDINTTLDLSKLTDAELDFLISLESKVRKST